MFDKVEYISNSIVKIQLQAIARNVKKHRLNKGLNQESLSHLADASHSTISSIENNKRSNICIDLLIKIGLVLECSLCDLLEFTNDESTLVSKLMNDYKKEMRY